MASPNDLITQVSQGNDTALMQEEPLDDYNTQINIDMRGHLFTITRDDLMALPESILLCLFPNGVFVDRAGNVITNLTDDDTVYVNFAPECFQYICQIFDTAVNDLRLLEKNHPPPTYDIHDPNILSDRPAIVVLREDLDYYCIPPVTGMTKEQMTHVKLLVGHKLFENTKIFDGLGYKPGKQLKSAEQHLMDMLCTSGFTLDGDWGHRSLEPGKTVVFSLTLARLQNNTTTNQHTPEDSPILKPVDSSTSLTSSRSRSRLSHLAHSISRSGSKTRKSNPNLTKLLLFWRKPARKCWWSDEVIDINIGDLGLVNGNGEKITDTIIKTHIRRVWTLELSVIGVN
ncbi:Whi2 protein [Martiniozyma asiatica (nom. inval.)]|nr:Whi2 protein [Martiniozyma asiatica]